MTYPKFEVVQGYDPLLESIVHCSQDEVAGSPSFQVLKVAYEKYRGAVLESTTTTTSRAPMSAADTTGPPLQVHIDASSAASVDHPVRITSHRRQRVDEQIERAIEVLEHKVEALTQCKMLERRFDDDLRSQLASANVWIPSNIEAAERPQLKERHQNREKLLDWFVANGNGISRGSVEELAKFTGLSVAKISDWLSSQEKGKEMHSHFLSDCF